MGYLLFAVVVEPVPPVFDKMLGPRLKGTPFKKTKTVYRITNTKALTPGQIYPMFMNAKKPTPIGVWTLAEQGEGAMSKKPPGYHSGRLPMAPHLRSKKTGKIAEGRVWVQAEIPVDTEYSAETIGEYNIPWGGYYEFKTTAAQGEPWYISCDQDQQDTQQQGRSQDSRRSRCA